MRRIDISEEVHAEHGVDIQQQTQQDDDVSHRGTLLLIAAKNPRALTEVA